MCCAHVGPVWRACRVRPLEVEANTATGAREPGRRSSDSCALCISEHAGADPGWLLPGRPRLGQDESQGPKKRTGPAAAAAAAAAAGVASAPLALKRPQTIGLQTRRPAVRVPAGSWLFFFRKTYSSVEQPFTAHSPMHPLAPSRLPYYSRPGQLSAWGGERAASCTIGPEGGNPIFRY